MPLLRPSDADGTAFWRGRRGRNARQSRQVDAEPDVDTDTALELEVMDAREPGRAG